MRLIIPVFILLSMSPAAYAAAPKQYLCNVESALGVTLTGESIGIKDPPKKFRFGANGPVFPEELRESPGRALDSFDAEPRRMSITGSIDTRLFAGDTQSMRSRGGIVYMQHGNVIRFGRDQRFIAYGLADPKLHSGVVVYTGICRAL